MKKKTVTKKTTPKRTVKRTAPKSVSITPLYFRRIVIISACLLLFFAGVITVNRHTVSQAVAGASITRGLFEQATISLPAVPNAVAYNIYYKRDRESDFSNAVRNIPANITAYTISHLKKDAVYQYRVSAVDKTGKEIYFSEVKQITDLQPM